MAMSFAYQKNNNSIDTDNSKDELNIAELWNEFFKTNSLELKNKLLTHYFPLVKCIVARMMPIYKSHNDYDDLFSCGVIGLMDAVDKFDASRNIKFETYASCRIRGEILDSMRRQDWAPSSLRRRINALEKAGRELEAKLLRAPTDQEIAEKLNISTNEVKKLVDQSHMFSLVRFDDVITNGSPNDHLKKCEDKDSSQEIERFELRDMLASLIDALSTMEKNVVALYYYKEYTFKEIASIMDVSESWISQVHSRTMKKLRIQIKDCM